MNDLSASNTDSEPLDVLVPSEIFTLSNVLNSLNYRRPSVTPSSDKDSSKDVAAQNHLASLFVSKGIHDVAAISTSFTANGISILTAKAPNVLPMTLTANANRQSTSKRRSKVNIHWLEEASSTKAFPNLATYIRHMEPLLKKGPEQSFFGVDSDYPEVYYLAHFFCSRKELQRLEKSRAPGSSTQEGRARARYLLDELVQISSDSIHSRFPGAHSIPSLDEDNTLKGFMSEAGIYAAMYDCDPPQDLPSNTYVLPFTAEVQRDLWKHFLGTLLGLRNTLAGMREFQGPKGRTLNEVAIDLVDITLRWEDIHELVHRSISFQRLLQSGAIYDKIFAHQSENETTRGHETPIQPRGDTASVQGTEGIADEDEDGDLLPEELEEESDEEQEALRQVSEGGRSLSFIRSWLKRCLRVTEALHLIMSGKVSEFLRTHPLSIRLLPNPSRSDISQLSLRALLDRLRQSEEYAHCRLDDLYNSTEDLLNAIITTIPHLSKHNYDTETKLIHSATVHCESILAAFLRSDANYRANALSIGISKRCCFCCHIVLTSLGFGNPSAHNKVYPWAPPSNLDPEVLLKILKGLRLALIEEIIERIVTRKEDYVMTAESSSGSEAEEIEPRRRRRPLRPNPPVR